jgi:hypothetical protein
MDWVKTALELIGLATTAIAVLGFFGVVLGWILGISPLLYRLGLGRWLRKITIVATSEEYASLKADMVDSGVFRDKNINHISKQDLSKVKDAGLLLVHYGSFDEKQIKIIISNKKSEAGMVVYFPGFSQTNRIPDDIAKLINNEPHTVLVNFRGRLINDVLTTLLSTSYAKK